MSETIDQFLTRDDVAERLRLSVRTIDKLIRNEGLPAVRLGNRVLIDPSDLRAWLATKKGPAVGEND